MIKKILFLSYLVLISTYCSSQKYGEFNADFSILEKNTLKDSSYIVLGKISYDLYKDMAIYNVSFPEQKTWEFKDSIMTVYDSDMNVERIDTLDAINELSIFKQILNNDLQDFGLTKAGFKLIDSEKLNKGIYLKYSAPKQIEFIKEVILKKETGLLKGIIFVDEFDKQFSKVFYSDYISVKDIDVPTKIKTHLTGQEEQVFKELQFRNVSIQ